MFPGRWDTAVGACHGELLEFALYREAKEELGFKDFNPVLLQTYVWESEVERELVNVFATVGDFSLHPSNDEVTEGRYWSMEEIEKHIGSSLFTPNFEQEFTSLKQIMLALL